MGVPAYAKIKGVCSGLSLANGDPNDRHYFCKLPDSKLADWKNVY
jgi:hypothetical protein